jgi:3-dehydroquinate dehydratase
MSNDIVVHLRRRAHAYGDVVDGRLDTLAADEIERLRDELRALRSERNILAANRASDQRDEHH